MIRSIPANYQKAIKFIIKFLAIYFVLYILDLTWIKNNFPKTIFFTDLVAYQSKWMLGIFSETVQLTWDENYPKIYLSNSERTVLAIFAGCNGVSVYIVFLSFALAFFRPSVKLFLFVLLALIVLNFSNVFRALSLYYISLNMPGHLYFYHKYVFNVVIFLEVVALCYYATKKIH
ncbi:MAG: exosortase/archaeosortase family protein [Cytophagales bacterium]|nr:exosortase/archaeosortase family protein [Cytophagales bacterium]